MALTVTNVSTPNAQINEFSLGPYKARMIDVTFDAAYLTTGEVLTADSLGWNQVFGVIELVPPSLSDGTLMMPARVQKNTANTQLTFQAYQYDGDATGDAVPLQETTSAFDASTYSGRYLVLGY